MEFEKVEIVLEPPEDFSFPFPPYEIQKEFMKALFTALEGRKLGIFESPTGTGKSLSLLCGSLTWLEQREQERISHLNRVINGFDVIAAEEEARKTDYWISAQAQLRKKKEVVAKAKRELAFVERLDEKRRLYLQRRTKVKRNLTRWGNKPRNAEDGGRGKEDSTENKDLGIEDLMINDDFAPEIHSDSDYEEEDKIEEPEFYPTKVIFASRTHSQLGQFANELKRTTFASKITAVSLGSRQNLCINPEVKKLKSLSLINERCLDLQKGSKGKKTSEAKKMKGCNGCPYFNHSGIEELKSQILAEPMDIEELVIAAKECNACPYYASRKASNEAQLVLLPYNTILHSGTREGVGIKVKNSVLLLDEAHNVIESISNMYSNSITATQLDDCNLGLKAYMTRYMTRFSAKNLLKLKQIGFVLKGMIRFMSLSEESESKVLGIQEFKMAIGVENQDFHELYKFMKKSKLVFKLKGYIHQKEQIEEKLADEAEAKKQIPKVNVVQAKKTAKGKSKVLIPTSKSNLEEEVKKPPRFKKSPTGQAVLNFSEFFKSLLTVNSEGRIIKEGKTLKFLLLNTSDHFQELIRSARSIILAGGTMKPYEEVEDQLFSSAKERIYHFSCDHVIPDENLVCLALCRGPSSTLFDFTFKNRKSPVLMEELSRTLVNLSKIVPGGLVCFLPSYDYEATLQEHLKSSGMLEKIECKKKVFREPKDSNCDTVLTEYSRQIKNSAGGAVLFAVVGGKLSEGINFGDELGRCVIVVGLPYPNIKSLEIIEKVQFVSERFGADKGSQLLTNMCSKAVNQSIGRAIRHSSDYATIILVDHRYARPNQRALLPNWILKRFQVCEQFGQAVKSVSTFFNAKRTLS